MMTTTTSLQMRATSLAILLISLNYSPVTAFQTSRSLQQPPLQNSNQNICRTCLHQDITSKATTESETDLQIRERILDEIDSGLRAYTQDSIDLSEYGEPEVSLTVLDISYVILALLFITNIILSLCILLTSYMYTTYNRMHLSKMTMMIHQQ